MPSLPYPVRVTYRLLRAGRWAALLTYLLEPTAADWRAARAVLCGFALAVGAASGIDPADLDTAPAAVRCG